MFCVVGQRSPESPQVRLSIAIPSALPLVSLLPSTQRRLPAPARRLSPSPSLQPMQSLPPPSLRQLVIVILRDAFVRMCGAAWRCLLLHFSNRSIHLLFLTRLFSQQASVSTHIPVANLCCARDMGQIDLFVERAAYHNSQRNLLRAAFPSRRAAPLPLRNPISLIAHTSPRRLRCTTATAVSTASAPSPQCLCPRRRHMPFKSHSRYHRSSETPCRLANAPWHRRALPQP